jgi:hypothetical protein
MSELHKRQRTTLRKIFTHPIDMNIEWTDVLAMFGALGAEITESHGRSVKITLDGHAADFARPRHSHSIRDKGEIMKLRHFLEAAGVQPDEDGEPS